MPRLLKALATSLMLLSYTLSTDVCATFATRQLCLRHAACSWCQFKTSAPSCANATHASRHVSAVPMCSDHRYKSCAIRTTMSGCSVFAGCAWCTKITAPYTSACKPNIGRSSPGPAGWKCTPPTGFRPSRSSLKHSCGNATIPPSPGALNVLIIGDSISMAMPYTDGGYGRNVQVPTAACRVKKRENSLCYIVAIIINLYSGHAGYSPRKGHPGAARRRLV
jgi:hypothetical protein